MTEPSGDIITFHSEDGSVTGTEDTRNNEMVAQWAYTRVQNQFDAMLNGGIQYNGHPMQIRDKDRGNIEGAVQDATLSIMTNTPWDAEFYWRMGDNEEMVIATAMDMITFGRFAKAQYLALMIRYWTANDSIAAALEEGDRESMDGIDL